jgi:hypothetical protein
VHSAKGKEWRHVLLPYFCNESFPHRAALYNIHSNGNLTSLGVAVSKARWSGGPKLAPFPAGDPAAACSSDLLPDCVTHVAASLASVAVAGGSDKAASASVSSSLRSGTAHADVFATPLRQSASRPGATDDYTADTLTAPAYAVSLCSDSDHSQSSLSCSAAAGNDTSGGAVEVASDDTGDSSSSGLIISAPRGLGGRGVPSPPYSPPDRSAQTGAASALSVAGAGAGAGAGTGGWPPRTAPPAIDMYSALPADKLGNSYTKVAEEKRVAYVALSRARDSLCILRPCQRRGAVFTKPDPTMADGTGELELYGHTAVETRHSPFLHPLTKSGLQWAVTWASQSL